MKKALLALIIISSILFQYCGITKKTSTKATPNSNVSSFNPDDDKILMTIGGTEITKGEFVRIYKKNNSQKNDQGAEKKSLQEYLQMFTDFKLKVKEAESLGLDTSEAFKKEFSGYRKQLSKPYFVDESIIDSLVVEAYDRYKSEVRASHILLKVSHDALPTDTLTTYNKIKSIRDQIVKGAAFADMVKQHTDDTGTKKTDGDLGYFTAFQMIYPFESAAYNTKVGEVSNIVRTSYGYHLVYVTDKRPNKGQIRAAHIMKLAPKDGDKDKIYNAQGDAYAIYEKLLKGADFAKLAEQLSDDKNSARKGGDLGWFRAGSMVQEFSDAAYALKHTGDICEPIQTQFGWHIIKLMGKREIESFEDIRTEFRDKVSRDARASLSKDIVINRIKEKYSFKDKKTISDFYTVVDSTIFQGIWNKEKAASLKKILFKIGNSETNQQEFADFLTIDKGRKQPTSINNYVDTKYKEFVNRVVINYEEARLEKEYPDFRYLLREYHDGILLFELTDKMVWSKAVKDSAGLSNYYEQNKSNYMWDERLDVCIFKLKDESVVEKAVALLDAKKEKEMDEVDVVNQICEKDSAAIKIVNVGKFEKTKNELVDFAWEETAKTNKNYAVKDNKLIYINQRLPKQQKLLNETKGVVTAEYQNLLEKQWIEELRKKYKVEVNEKILSTIEE